MATEKLEIEVIVNGQKAKIALNDVDSKINDIGKTADKTGGSIADMISSAKVGLMLKIAAAAMGVKKALDWAKEIDTLKTKMEVALGSVAKAEDKFGALQKKADEMGISFYAMADAYTKFKIASDLVGMSASDTEKVFNGVMTATAAMKLSADDTNAVFLALEQMLSKGTVQAEELKGQLGERLPGAFTLAAQSIGVTTEELNKMLANGEVVAKDMLPKLADALQNKFADGAAKSANSIQASYNRIENAFTTLKEAMLSFAENNGVVDLLGTVADKFGDIADEISRAAKEYDQYDAGERERELIDLNQQLIDKQKELQEVTESKANSTLLSTYYGERQVAIQGEIDLLTKNIEKLNELSLTPWTPTLTVEGIRGGTKPTKDGDKPTNKGFKSTFDERKRILAKFKDDYAEATLSSYDYEKQKIEEQYQEYAKYISDKTQLDEWRAAELKQLNDEHSEDLKAAAEEDNRYIDDLSQGIADMVTEGKFSFKDMLRSWLNDFLASGIKELLSQLWKSIAQTAVVKSTLALFGIPVSHTGTTKVMHTGGHVPSYHSGMRTDERMAKLQVGEAVINRAGASINRDAIDRMNRGESVGGGAVQQTVAEINFNVQAIDSTSFNSYLVNNRATIENIINKSLTTNGSVRRTIKQTV